MKQLVQVLTLLSGFLIAGGALLSFIANPLAEVLLSSGFLLLSFGLIPLFLFYRYDEKRNAGLFEIETPRLILRNLKMDDLDGFLKYRQDQNTARYQGWDPMSRKEAARFIQKHRILRPGIDRPVVQVAIVLKETGHLIGDSALRPDPVLKETIWLGGSINPDFQNQGYATEAFQALLMYCFRDLSYKRAAGMCMVNNTASKHLLQKLGMRKEAHMRKAMDQSGKATDAYIYAILEEECEGV